MRIARLLALAPEGVLKRRYPQGRWQEGSEADVPLLMTVDGAVPLTDAHLPWGVRQDWE